MLTLHLIYHTVTGLYKVSIILPTYNRAAFLPQALESIRSQTFTDWELIVVDDGSTDETETIVRQWSIPQEIRYVKQPNQGPSAARNAGLDLASGEYIAFFDSDDLWLPHHLHDCVDALNANLDVDWVYAATRMVEQGTGRILASNTFYQDGVPRPFLSLRIKPRGELQLIEDGHAIQVAIEHALYAGLQVSVIRRRLFEKKRLPPFRIAEDQLFSILCMAEGNRFAYFTKVHAHYHVHEGNCSTAAGCSINKRLSVTGELIRAFESLPKLVSLTGSERRAWRRRLNREYFWNLGYALEQAGRRQEARAMYGRGLRYSPLNPRQWKTYMASLFRTVFHLLLDRLRPETAASKSSVPAEREVLGHRGSR